MDRLSLLFVSAVMEGASSTLEEIMRFRDMVDFADDPLGAIIHLREEASVHRIEMKPDPGEVRSWATPIVFSRRRELDPDAVGARILPLLEAGTEMPDVEFKSTMWLDLDRRKHDLAATADKLKSTSVCNSTMKTICGFLNESGGTLIVGASDDGAVVGIEEEFEVACAGDLTIDGWLQQARASVFQFFHEPEEVWNHLRLEVAHIGGKHLAVFTIVPRMKLSICKCKNMKEFKVYSRRGSSTDEVPLTGLETYITGRKL